MNQRILIELLRGRGAHADSIQCFRGLDFEQAGRMAEGFPHTLWQLLSHLNYWMRYELARISGTNPEYPEHAAESWPTDRAPQTSSEWNTEVRAFEALLSKLARFAESGEETLRRVVPSTDKSHEGTDASLLGVLCQTVVHNSYHLGQVVLLRRAFGAWPPPGGGDTW
jgi:uncharacterized damage-inducible protein DinB